MHKNIPIITVTCTRDLPLLELQAQSINLYLDKNCPVWIIVNEENTAPWFDYFNKHIKDYYNNHNLSILTLHDFDGEWFHWTPNAINPWAIGWETQQILKLAIATKISSVGYLVLDSQNFLIKSWSHNNFDLDEYKVPYRKSSVFSMPIEIWNQYAKWLDFRPRPPNRYGISITTPMFLHTDLVKGLIDLKGGLRAFSKWFKFATNIKSEFILYALWVIKNNALEKCHQQIDDYASPYLRDCNTAEEFTAFINFLGVHDPHRWASINHRAWGNMTADQYNQLCIKLKDYNLTPKFDSYRKEYIDLKF